MEFLKNLIGHILYVRISVILIVIWFLVRSPWCTINITQWPIRGFWCVFLNGIFNLFIENVIDNTIGYTSYNHFIISTQVLGVILGVVLGVILGVYRIISLHITPIDRISDILFQKLIENTIVAISYISSKFSIVNLIVNSSYYSFIHVLINLIENLIGYNIDIFVVSLIVLRSITRIDLIRGKSVSTYTRIRYNLIRVVGYRIRSCLIRVVGCRIRYNLVRVVGYRIRSCLIRNGTIFLAPTHHSVHHPTLLRTISSGGTGSGTCGGTGSTSGGRVLLLKHPVKHTRFLRTVSSDCLSGGGIGGFCCHPIRKRSLLTLNRIATWSGGTTSEERRLLLEPIAKLSWRRTRIGTSRSGSARS